MATSHGQEERLASIESLLARNETMLSSLLKNFEEFKTQGHPDCKVRDVRISNLERDFNGLGGKLARIETEAAAKLTLAQETNVAQESQIKHNADAIAQIVKLGVSVNGAILVGLLTIITEVFFKR